MRRDGVAAAIACVFVLALGGCRAVDAPGTESYPERKCLASGAKSAYCAPPTGRDWFAPSADWAKATELAVWASPYSVVAPETLTVYIHSSLGAVNLTLFRIGWYGGDGAIVVWHRPSVEARAQPSCTPPFPGPVVCPWSPAIRVAISTSWPSGVYLVRAVNRMGQMAWYPFVLRSKVPADFSVVVPQFTWQAYNSFGGSSLYTIDPNTKKNVHFASFDRPYVSRGGATYMFGKGRSNDISAIRFLERNGYSLNYISDADLAGQHGSFVLPRKGFIFSGHDEYWTYHELESVTKLRDQGEHLAFLSGNIAYWNIRLGPGEVTGRSGESITCWRQATDPGATSPQEVTSRFDQAPLNRPANALVGVQFVSMAKTGTLYPLTVSDSGATALTSTWLDDAGLSRGDTLRGLIGDEGDAVVDNGFSPPNLQVLFRSPVPALGDGHTIFYYSSFYVSKSGAGVFATGTNEWGRGLDSFFPPQSDSMAVQRITKDVLDWMLAH